MLGKMVNGPANLGYLIHHSFFIVGIAWASMVQ